MLKRFAAAWRFLTIFPLPWQPDADEATPLRDSPGMFPVVGLAVGGIAGLVMWLLGGFFPPVVLAALAVAALAYPSGALHLDGLADSADALSSPGRDREKALEIMKDSRVGAHGAVALAVVLLVKFACLSTLPVSGLVVSVIVIPLAGRAAMMFPMVLLPYARKQGLGGLFVIEDKRTALAMACAWTGIAMFLAWGLRGAFAGMVLWLAVSVTWVRFLRRRLGGATGDSYGAMCELAETAACLAAAMAYYEVM